MNNAASDLQYVILPGRPQFGFEGTRLYEQAYEFWRSFWTRVLADVGVDHGPEPDEFCRQDRVCLLVDQNDEIAAMLCYTFYDLAFRATAQRGYFMRYFTPDFFNALKARGISRVMSLEYMSVAPAWRRLGDGASLARLIAVLGLRQVGTYGCDAGIAAARCDVGIDQLSHELGGESVVKDVKVHGISTDLVAFPRNDIREPTDPNTSRIVERLWRERSDYTAAVGAQLLRSVA
jgi:hypothetical protein